MHDMTVPCNPSGETNLFHVVMKHGLDAGGLLVSVQLFHLSTFIRWKVRRSHMILATRLSQIVFNHFDLKLYIHHHPPWHPSAKDEPSLHLRYFVPLSHPLWHLSPNELHAHLALKNGLPLAGMLVQTKHFGARSHPPFLRKLDQIAWTLFGDHFSRLMNLMSKLQSEGQWIQVRRLHKSSQHTRCVLKVLLSVAPRWDSASPECLRDWGCVRTSFYNESLILPSSCLLEISCSC